MRSLWNIIKLKDKNVRTILSWAFLYLLFLWIGIEMISEFKRYGSYLDYKHGLWFGGEGARIAGYGVAGVAGIGLFYTVYLLVISIIKKRNKTAT